MATKKIKARELPIPSGAAEDPDALEILRVWVRHDADGETAVAANHRLETANPDPSGVGGVIGSACVSIVEDMIEDLSAKTNAQRAQVTVDFLMALVEEFGVRLERDDLIRRSWRARH
jgi:hypothetical protein